ncbi:MAG: LCP family protein [Nocardiopsaceae bacterium]|nr:LCP family protein [Nocardiopsaceae bacterium]
MLIAILIAVALFVEFRINHSAVFTDYPGRPAASGGVNWLIVGSDSRQGLTRQQENQLVIGHDVSGMRSDTMMVLHIPDNGGRPTLVSLPRDSYVPIPGHRRNKLNAAFSSGGPSLLARTVQNVTGLRITHYAEIGFGGLVRVVNAVGGVRICVSRKLDDKKSGTHLSAGCHMLNGEQSLAFVRDRHSFRGGDLQREHDQRVFLEALLRKATSPAVYLNPVAAATTTLDASGLLHVDNGTHLWDLYRLATALPNARTMNVPIGRDGTVPRVGDVLYWNEAKAHALFTALANDRQAAP